MENAMSEKDEPRTPSAPRSDAAGRTEQDEAPRTKPDEMKRAEAEQASRPVLDEPITDEERAVAEALRRLVDGERDAGSTLDGRDASATLAGRGRDAPGSLHAAMDAIGSI